MIEEYIPQICARVGEVRPPVDPKALHRIHRKKDFTGMVRYIRNTLNLKISIRLCFVKDKKPRTPPAWIVAPKKIPLYGTLEFKNLRPIVYIRQEFLARAPFETVVLMIAHELSHIVLEATGGQFENEEIAVDLTAMILGYRNFFYEGCKYTERTLPADRHLSFKNRMFRIIRTALGMTQYTVGYLKPKEIEFAANILDKRTSDSA